MEIPPGNPRAVTPLVSELVQDISSEEVHQTEHREVGGDSRRGKLGKPGKGAGAQRSLKKNG